MQRHYVMYYEMSYGLNVEMHKQTEIAKRLNAIIAQILPFLSQEHQQQVATAVDRAKQVTMTELNAIIGQQRPDLPSFFSRCTPNNYHLAPRWARIQAYLPSWARPWRWSSRSYVSLRSTSRIRYSTGCRGNRWWHSCSSPFDVDQAGHPSSSGRFKAQRRS